MYQSQAVALYILISQWFPLFRNWIETCAQLAGSAGAVHTIIFCYNSINTTLSHASGGVAKHTQVRDKSEYDAFVMLVFDETFLVGALKYCLFCIHNHWFIGER